ncbi:MAG: hypothetical protein H6605_10805 [Flavobacteriales bacterium]|nr:hypothetical protein [Flavobacteriales bacterium]
MRNILVFLVATIFGCTNKKNADFEIVVESCKIIYTVPDFYLDSLNFDSKVYFSYSMRIKNISDSNMTFINQFNFYDSAQKKAKMRINTRFDYGKIIVRSGDSINIEYLSNEKFSTKYNPKTLNEEIFERGDQIIALTRVYFKKDNLFVEIKKAPDYFTASEPINEREIQKVDK